MEWNILNIALSTLFVCIGALLQAATGLGAGLIIVPLLANVSIALIPGPMIFASLTLTLTMAFTGRKNIDFSNMNPILVGLLLGTVVAATYIATLPMDKLGMLFGIMILFAVALSLRAPRFSFSKKGLISAGALSGFMGASAGVGAPILALLYQHQSGPSIRSTLAFLYVVSSIAILFFLNIAGRFGESEMISGLLLMPGFILGYLFSTKLARFIDKGYARPAVLLISTLSAGLLIWQSLAVNFL